MSLLDHRTNRIVPTWADAEPAAAATPCGVDEAILEPTAAPRRALLLALAAAAAITAAGFVVTSTHPDEALSATLNAQRTGLVGATATGIYHLFSPVPAILLTVALTALIWMTRRSLWVAGAFAGVVACTWIPSAVVKLLVHRPRPAAAYLAHPYSPTLTDASFPSGHTVFVASLAIATAMLLRRSRWFVPVALGGAVGVGAVAVALCIDGVHYPTDVVASIVWALCVAPAARFVWVDLVLPRLPLVERLDALTRR